MIRAEQNLCQPSGDRLKADAGRPIQIHHIDRIRTEVRSMQTRLFPVVPGAMKDASAGAGAGVASAGRATPIGSERQSMLRALAAEVLGALGPTAASQRTRGHRDGHDAPGAVAEALRSALAQGGDPQRLLAKVQDGIESAGAALAGRGFDPAQVAAAASQFTARVTGLLDASAAQGSAAAGSQSLDVGVQIARKERGSLTLTTQDGDVLRIRFRSSERQQLELASRQTEGGQATRVDLQSRERSRTQVEVEGSLDAAELKAIEDFVGKVDALANEFFEGDLDAAFAAAAALDYDMSEIAGFSLKLGYSERVQARAVQTTTTAFPAQAPAPAPLPAPVPATAANGAAPDGAEAAPRTGTVTAPESTTPSRVAVEARSDGDDPLRAVQDFMRKALQAADAPVSVSGYRLAWSAKLQWVAEAVSAAAPPGGGKAGAAVLVDALDRVAGAAGADAPRVKLAEAA